MNGALGTVRKVLSRHTFVLKLSRGGLVLVHPMSCDGEDGLFLPCVCGYATDDPASSRCHAEFGAPVLRSLVPARARLRLLACRASRRRLASNTLAASAGRTGFQWVGRASRWSRWSAVRSRTPVLKGPTTIPESTHVVLAKASMLGC